MAIFSFSSLSLSPPCPPLFCSLSLALLPRFLVRKFKYITEQVMVMEPGKRKMDPKVIVQTMKAAEFLFKFMMRSRYLYDQ